MVVLLNHSFFIVTCGRGVGWFLFFYRTGELSIIEAKDMVHKLVLLCCLDHASPGETKKKNISINMLYWGANTENISLPMYIKLLITGFHILWYLPQNCFQLNSSKCYELECCIQ